MRDRRPETVSFPLRAWLVLAAFGVLMVGMLVLNNIQIGAQLAVVRQQLDFQANADPLIRDGRSLATDATRRLEETRRAQRDAARLVRQTRPLVADLRDAEIDEVLPTVGALTEGLSTRNRLVRLVDRTDRLIAEFERTGFLQRGPQVADDTNRIVREILRIQRDTLAVQRRTLAVQEEALVRIRSIDDKTGGPAPGAAPVR